MTSTASDAGTGAHPILLYLGLALVALAAAAAVTLWGPVVLGVAGVVLTPVMLVVLILISLG